MASSFPAAGSDYVKHGISVLPGCEGRVANRLHGLYNRESVDEISRVRGLSPRIQIMT